MLDDLYPDWKKGFISQEMYFAYRDKYTKQKEEILKKIDEINEQIEIVKNGFTKENRFIENFKKYQNITELTRDIIVELIENIYIYEGGKIEVVVRFRDEYLTALEYIELNRQVYIKQQQFKNAQVVVSV